MGKIIALGWLLMMANCFAAAEMTPLPDGWRVVGNARQKYRAGLDPTVVREGRPAGLLESKERDIEGGRFGALMQSIEAKKYLGSRLRLSAWVRCQNVRGWVGLWLRVDGRSEKVLEFDNMEARPLKGDLDWKRVEVVLDVPRHALSIHYGMLMSGSGRAWLSGMKVETVSKEVPTTKAREEGLPLEPVNLF